MDTADFYFKEFWLSEWERYFPDVDDKTNSIQDGEKESVQEYLHRGEIIESCARKTTRRKYCVNEDLFKKIFTKKALEKAEHQKIMYLKSRITAGVIRPICSDIAERYRDTGLFDAKEFHELFDESLHIKLQLENGGYGQQIIRSLCRRHHNPDTCVVSVSISDKETAYAPLDDRLTARQNGSGYYLKAYGKKTTCKVLDMGLYFADYAILSMVLKHLKELPAENREENRIWGRLNQILESKIKRHMQDGILYITEDIGKNDLFIRYIRQKNISYTTSKSEQKLGLDDISEFFLMNGKLSDNMLYCMICAEDLFVEMMEEYRKDKSTEVFLKELSDRARVWQTKKNIPDKIVKAMQKSSFNNFFGYVEFDEEVDLHAMNEIENEWNAISTLFHWTKREYVSIRFRKLGNHHATGLYFPTLKCLCVDIRSPSSMVHEYFHMLDFEENDLSRGQSFCLCEKLYSEALKEYIQGLPKTDPCRMQWEGKNKYNYSYYLEPTEIFARCGEMYMTRVLCIDNSLCRPEKGFAYPENADLLEEIERYFNQMFQKLHFIGEERSELEENI